MQHDEDRLLELKADYLKRWPVFLRENIQDKFNNCSLFRISIHILRERLLTFIQERFEEFIRQSDTSKASIKKTIKDNVRTIDPSGKSLEYNANHRKERIDALNDKEFAAD